MFIIQVNDNDGVLKDLCYIGFDRKRCEEKFLKACAKTIPNWEEGYSSRNKSDILDNGYVEFVGGAVNFIDASNCRTDSELRDQLTKQPAGDVTVAEIVEEGELALKEGMTVDEILELCGENLDGCNSWDIQGQILFKGSDGKWYTITTESIVGEASHQFVCDTLVENDHKENS